MLCYLLARVTSISTAEVQTGKYSEWGKSSKAEGRKCAKSCERQEGTFVLSVHKVFDLQLWTEKGSTNLSL